MKRKFHVRCGQGAGRKVNSRRTLIKLSLSVLQIRGYGIRTRLSSRNHLIDTLKTVEPTLGALYERELENSFVFESPNASLLADIFESKTKNKKLITDIDQIDKFLRKYENKSCGEQLKFFN